MNRKFYTSSVRLATLFCLLLLTQFGFASDNENKSALEEQYLGVWMGDNGEERFEIYKKGDKYFGKIIWTAYDDLHGQGLVDSKNPDPEKRTQSLIGLDILLDFELNNNGVLNGRVYDPGSGNTYKCRIKLEGDKAEVRGYILVPLLGRTEIAYRVKE